MAIGNVENIRDLLIAIIAPEIAWARREVAERRYPRLTRDEAIVAWVLDALTIRSLETLIALRRKEGKTE